ncbi:hypothetical protein EJ05DRAFT_492029 [Pseudovirgaria hyperparasitica]|uniref:Mannosyltransferase n=1 Tax=Pseudovirgaria hyperparasitica TaxID=470096 RepID=A0A6A6WB84_9PEZI|nr:uncharacterized protein EJ05DRAFT_492029 [Pseudovirgaria hyperparasitica]KAF2760102.1 hypothetical protein EJ05DRAFT_492029 [Pseudovirgaria hyperparasitica]
MAPKEGIKSATRVNKDRDVTEAVRGIRHADGSPSPGLDHGVAFCIFLAVNAAAALFAPIQDCDEVFNYWEPTHYLNHGYGLQTWEYSPDYAIRSWFYSGLHASVISILQLLSVTKHVEFYFLRLVFAFVCALCETRLYEVIQKTVNWRVALFFLIIIVTSPGMFHSSTAYLPSTFAMYTTMLGVSSFMDWRDGLRTAQGIMWFAVGACVGWPFAGALILPFILEEFLLAFVSSSGIGVFTRLLDGAVRSLLVLALQVAIDTWFYRKLTIVPWNIVDYNVLSNQEKGPNIYGTEPWHFYGRNLLINFNVWFVFALLSCPLLLWQHLTRRQKISNMTILRAFVFVSPFYLWLGIFTLQPHKEERFMYPVYPALALNAAMSLHIVLSYIGSTDPRDLASKVPASVKFGLVSIFMLGALDLGVLRTLSLATGYAAPLQVYSPLRSPGVALPGDSICLGKEWYRFPSSYHMPDGVKAKFVKSEFSGLLPGEFHQTDADSGFYPATWQVPSGMNDRNEEDLGKYIDIAQCKFMVDSSFPSTVPSELEPNYIEQTDTWEALKCEAFLDSASTGILGRLLYVPDWPIVPERLRRRWGTYCLLRRRGNSNFKRPVAAPYPDWSITHTKPLSYRPFRHGPKYYITMGLRSMHWDEWIELDNEFIKFHAQKAERIAARGKKCCHTAPDAYDGAIELLEELCSYLPQRYPSMYRKTDVGMDNIVTGESFDIVARPLAEDPMQMGARWVQDDLAIMFLNPDDGQYYLRAGAILLAGFWRLEDKFGMCLSDIHTSGDVPGFKEKLERGMLGFFRRLTPEKPMLRNNYFIQVDDKLAWSESIGSEDSEGIGWYSAEKNKPIMHHWFRSERQSLRRLPRSGGVLFTIRTYFHPITSIAQEPYVPGRLASAIRSWGDDVSRYKGKEQYGEVLLEYLDKMHERQVADGLKLEEEDKVRTYPW